MVIGSFTFPSYLMESHSRKRIPRWLERVALKLHLFPPIFSFLRFLSQNPFPVFPETHHSERNRCCSRFLRWNSIQLQYRLNELRNPHLGFWRKRVLSVQMRSLKMWSFILCYGCMETSNTSSNGGVGKMQDTNTGVLWCFIEHVQFGWGQLMLQSCNNNDHSNCGHI